MFIKRRFSQQGCRPVVRILWFSQILAFMMSKVSAVQSKEGSGVENAPKPSKVKKTKGSDVPAESFPDTLDEFGYEFNADGQLRHKETGKPFEFNVSDSPSYNQKRYEALGEILTKYVYNLLETEVGLQRSFIPICRENLEPQTFIFLSDDALSNPDKLLLLIHGSGVVRAGQWARKLIINDCLNSGTQLPYIKEAQKRGYGVMLFNTNDNRAITKDGKLVKIRGSESAEKHVHYVWENFVTKAKAKHIAIVAHSFGGFCVMDLLNSHQEALMKRVFAIALTDSVHDLEYQGVSKTGLNWLQKVGRNWVSSGESLDVPISIARKQEIPAVSAGDKRHDMTSWSSFKSVFRFLSEQYKVARGGAPDTSSNTCPSPVAGAS